MENKNTVESIENKWWIRLLIILSRWVVGATFIFSGFVKAIDPMGSVYKFNDYFVAFGLEFLIPLSLIFAVLLAAFEFMIGVNMFLGSYRRLTSCLVLFTMIFMTPLTLYLAIANPVSDCGCFGDALILTNWQTFFKNVLLLAITIFLFTDLSTSLSFLSVSSELSLSGILCDNPIAIRIPYSLPSAQGIQQSGLAHFARHRWVACATFLCAVIASSRSVFYFIGNNKFVIK